uniref:Protein OS-9-like n=1 Tax=Hirondellea gigas TaxID=1518452 RepID=A0A6A7FRT2_9CRUS
MRGKMLIILIMNIVFFYFHQCHAFNIDEINSIYYNIDILSNPVKMDKSEMDESTLVVVNRFGQDYACSLPSLPADLKGLGNKDDPTFQEDSIDIAELLRPMKAAPCLVTSKGWWTYEFCYGHIIKQYHLDDGKSRGFEMVLGMYESEYDWSSGGKGGADASGSSNSNRLQRFHSQFYSNGTKCDLTGEPRKTEVRFKCESDVGDYIERVDEPESCRYIVTVATTRVCHHPYLRPHPSRTPHSITCTPVLAGDKFDEYTAKVKEKTRLLEGKVKQRMEEIMTDRRETVKIEIFSFGDVSKATKKLLEVVGKAEDATASGSGSVVPVIGEATAKQDRAPTASDGIIESVGDVTALRDEEKENKSLPKDDIDLDEVDVEVEVHDVNENSASVDFDSDDFGSEDDEGEDDGNEDNIDEDDGGEDDDNEQLDEDSKGSPHMSPMTKIVFDMVKDKKNVLKALEFVEKRPGDTVESLQQSLEEILNHLEHELDTLSRSASGDGDDGMQDLWDAFSRKLSNIRSQHKIGQKKKRRKFEPERGTPEWKRWRFSKNEKTIAKAREVLLNSNDKKSGDNDEANDKDSTEDTEVNEAISSHNKKWDRIKYLKKKLMTEFLNENGAGSLLEAITTAVATATGTKPDADAASSSTYTKLEDYSKTEQELMQDFYDVLAGPVIEQILEQYIDDQDSESGDGEKAAGSSSKEGVVTEEKKKKKENSVAISSLQQSIIEKLKNSGLNLNNHKIEVKILTPESLLDMTKDGEATISGEQANSVETLLFKLLGAQKDEIVEREKHETLNKNYNFNYDDLDAYMSSDGTAYHDTDGDDATSAENGAGDTAATITATVADDTESNTSAGSDDTDNTEQQDKGDQGH